MLKRTTSVAAAALLSSCAAAPQFTEQTLVSAASVVKAVQCEIDNGMIKVKKRIHLEPRLKPGKDPLKPDEIKWGVAYSLNLKMDNKNNLSVAPFDWSHAFSGGTFTFSPTPKYTETSSRSGKLAYSYDIDEGILRNLKQSECDAGSTKGPPLIRGNLGVEQWLTEAARFGALNGKSSELSFNAIFIVEQGADFKPAFKVVNLSAGLTSGALQTRTNTLTVSLKRNDNKNTTAAGSASAAATSYQFIEAFGEP